MMALYCTRRFISFFCTYGGYFSNIKSTLFILRVLFISLLFYNLLYSHFIVNIFIRFLHKFISIFSSLIIIKIMSISSHEYQPNETLKCIANCLSFQQYLEGTIIECIKQFFPSAAGFKISDKIRDHNFYGVLKKLAQVYQNFTLCLMNPSKSQLGQQIGAQFKQKNQGLNLNIDLQYRKNTRATFAMRNSKNQQELKKDQIFVRVIPRTHNCIHFMVKNHNFPRIQCRLSCNQHLQYLVTYLTNKWLRGKVGVGYQIKLYPDPSTYMHKHSTEGKRPNIIHQPLNNYLMFTDIMAAFGVAQNGCINLLYDIAEMRKQKQKYRVPFEKQSPLHSSYNNYQIRLLKGSQKDEKEDKKQSQTPFKKKQKMNNQSLNRSHYKTSLYPNSNEQSNEQESSYKKYNDRLNSRKNQEHQLKFQQNIRQMTDNQDELSIGMHRDKKSYIGNNSIDYSEVNSLGYHFNNGFNSNQLLGNLFNINNSNTFLNIYDNPQRMISSDHPIPIRSQEKQIINESVMDKNIDNSINVNSQNQLLTSYANRTNLNLNQNLNLNNGTLLPNNEDKLQSIRNIISFVEKEADLFARCPDKPQEISDQKSDIKHKQENSVELKVEKEKDNVKKEVKKVAIIKKKNQSVLFD